MMLVTTNQLLLAVAVQLLVTSYVGAMIPETGRGIDSTRSEVSISPVLPHDATSSIRSKSSPMKYEDHDQVSISPVLPHDATSSIRSKSSPMKYEDHDQVSISPVLPHDATSSIRSKSSPMKYEDHDQVSISPVL
eukprot:Lankesteria_metandrocarpae@DN5316_c1_g1_i1.p2